MQGKHMEPKSWVESTSMSAKTAIQPLEARVLSSWPRYLYDSLLATAGSLLITGFIALLHLYPLIPNISVLYLLIILGLASSRGRYAAIVASLVAFLSFDFFLVPPLYVFTVAHAEEWVALFVFLVTALLTGQMASTLRLQAQEARRRERETHILYELVRTTNNDERTDQHLQTIANAIVNVFSSWGIHDCAILLPDKASLLLTVQASAPLPVDKVQLSDDERTIAMHVMKSGQAVGLHDVTFAPERSPGFSPRIIIRNTVAGHAARLRLIPLKTGGQTVGVLRLGIQGGPFYQANPETLLEEHERIDPRTTFFWTFLDQATSVIERARLRRESMHVEILQRTDVLRKALLSSVSHDLRTPLSSIKAAASSLLQDDVQWNEEEKRSFAQAIEREADRLNRLVGNLLDMSRIEEGVLKLEKEHASISELAHTVLEHMQPSLQHREIRTHLQENLPLIDFDYIQMDQVLTNLIENAVRYTPRDTPIDLGIEQKDDTILITVADRGPGIPQADLERVFDKFYRVQRDKRKSNYPTGSGLGLAVCKGIVEAHGGHIWAQARDGGGVVFSVTLPIKQSKQLHLQTSEARYY
jgi:two-component system, OmpR family, sensor histidine kinase KdpD